MLLLIALLLFLILLCLLPRSFWHGLGYLIMALFVAYLFQNIDISVGVLLGIGGVIAFIALLGVLSAIPTKKEREKC